MKNIILILTFMFFYSTSAFSKTTEWRVNQDHSEVLFKVSYLSLSSVTGRFNSFEGEATFLDDEDPLPEEISVEIDANSLFSGNNMRDGHLKSSDFFKVKTFPIMTFQSKRISPVGEGGFVAIGSLTIKDVKREVKVSFTSSKTLKDTWKNKNRFIQFEMEINRSDFGLSWNKMTSGESLLIGESVKVSGTFQMQLPSKRTVGSKFMIPNTLRSKLTDKLRLGKIAQSDYDKAVVKLIQKPKKENSPSTIVKAPFMEDPPRKKSGGAFELDGKWMMWLLVLCGFGFLGSIYAAVSIKEFCAAYFKSYLETNSIGVLTDFPVLFIVFIYAYAAWYVLSIGY